MRHIRKNNLKGSLTVEACIAFPIFLCFFLLLAFFIRVACINITLNHAVNETAKQLAASAYPITFLNELEDEAAGGDADYSIPTYEEEMSKVKSYISNSFSSEDVLPMLLTGNTNMDSLSGSIASLGEGLKNDAKAALKSFLVKEFGGMYFDAKTRLKYMAAEYLVSKHCEGSFVNIKNIKYLMVELPQGATEYEIKNSYPDYRKIYDELGCKPDPDNIVVAVEYRIRIPIPFFKDREIVSRHVAVERAWLNGSNGVYTKSDTDTSDEAAKSDEKNSTENDRMVYITRFGERYHEQDCPSIKIRQKTCVTLNYARSQGRTPCEICILKTSKFGRKK